MKRLSAVIILVFIINTNIYAIDKDFEDMMEDLKDYGFNESDIEEYSEMMQGITAKAKPNLLERGKYGWMTNCEIDDMQLYMMCQNAKIQYLNYLKMIGTERESEAYNVHKAAVEVAVKFYERTKTSP